MGNNIETWENLRNNFVVRSIQNPQNVMQVFHWRPNLRLYIYVRSAAKVGGSGTKIHKKRWEIFGSASTTRHDMKHTGSSGSRGQPAVGSECFVQTGLETTRTSPKALTDKP